MLEKTSCSFVMLSLLSLAACTDGVLDATDEPTLGEATSPLFAQGVAPGSARFMVKNGSMCIAAPVSGNGPVVQLPCASEQRFWWVAEPDKVADPTGSNRIFKIHNHGRCLDVPDNGRGSVTSSNTNLQAFSCAQPMAENTQQNQQFIFRKIVTGEYQIQPRLGVASNLCLDIAGGTTAPGSALQQFPCKSTDVDNQRFLLRPRLYQNRGLACDDTDILRVTTSNNNDTVPNNVIVNFSAGPFNTIRMTCDGDTEERICKGATADIDRLRSAADEYTFTCWE